MNSRFFARFEKTARVFPYLLSLTAITFAVACGNNNNNKQKVPVVPVKPKAEQNGQSKLAQLFPKTDLTNEANLDLALRIEGGTVELEPIDDEKKIYSAVLNLLIRQNSAENNAAKKAVLIQAEGELHADLAEAINKARNEKDDATKKELFKKSFLLINKEASSADASKLYAIQAFCIEDCKKLAVRVLEDDRTLSAANGEDGQKQGGVDETRYNRQVAIEFAPAANAAGDDLLVLQIANFNIAAVTEGRGDEVKKIDPSTLTKRSFEAAMVEREKNGTKGEIIPVAEGKGEGDSGKDGSANKEDKKKDEGSGPLEELDPLKESIKT